jgi:hypothetical protein
LDKHYAETWTLKAQLDTMDKRAAQSNGRCHSSTGDSGLFATEVEENASDRDLKHSSDPPTRKRSRTTKYQASMTGSTAIHTCPLPNEVEAPATPSNRGLHAPIPHEQQIKADADDGLPTNLMDIYLDGREFRVSEVDVSQPSISSIVHPAHSGPSAVAFESRPPTYLRRGSPGRCSSFCQAGCEFEPMYIRPGKRPQYTVLAPAHWKRIEGVRQDSEQTRRLGRILSTFLRREAWIGGQAGHLVFKNLQARLCRRGGNSGGNGVGDD